MTLLRKLKSKRDVDEAIRNVEERVLVLRFGRDDEVGCLQTDDIVWLFNFYFSFVNYFSIYLCM